LEENKVTLEAAQKLGLLPEEFEKIKEILGRTPNFTELSVYSVMWSEHCSYKNSITWLKTLPKDGPMMLAKAGEENAGMIDIGGGLGCCFKIESHNHPSAIEPYQGAATGVGGINRDIFSMGARPIAQLNSLRFGDPGTDRTKWLVKGVVKGIGDYGNAFGIPTVGGEVYFDNCYQTNNLVNAMSVGIVKAGKNVSAVATGAGNPVYIFGSTTGRDGIHGATFASEEISESSSEKLPSVQVGDPFAEKLILEASLELIEAGGVVGMQDMGAAGITCSTSEMAAKGEHGIEIHLDRVPMRQAGMKDWEILLSESQERMLVIIEKGHEHKAEKIFDKWDLSWAQIGTVTETGRVQYFMHGKMIADIPAESLVLGGGAPVYTREYTEPEYMVKVNLFNENTVPQPESYQEVARMLVGLPNIASRRWVYNQYDSMVGTVNQSTNAPSDAAVVRVKDSETSLVLTVDCNSRYIHANPDIGTQIAVSEAARNIICSGGTPAAITNCLNFGNPYNPEVYWQFVGAINGMRTACLKFATPVTGGNVSFYNQSSDGTAVFPTPTIGMVGLMKGDEQHMTLDFKNPGDLIYLLGMPKDDIASSQYLVHYFGEEFSPAPEFDLDEEHALHIALADLIANKIVLSAHDVSEGGLFISLLESAMPRNKGFEINTFKEVRKDAFLFGESQSRVVVTVNPGRQKAFEAKANELEQAFLLLGTVTDGDISIDGEKWGPASGFTHTYETSLEKMLEA
jgi:phosphoribosylformylglycinamidine synthase II